jgi:hypothetical protein
MQSAAGRGGDGDPSGRLTASGQCVCAGGSAMLQLVAGVAARPAKSLLPGIGLSVRARRFTARQSYDLRDAMDGE